GDSIGQFHTGYLKSLNVGVKTIAELLNSMFQESQLDNRLKKEGATANKDDVIYIVPVTNVVKHFGDGIFRNFLSRRQVLGNVILFPEYLRLLVSSKRVIDSVVVTELCPFSFTDPVRDNAQNIEHTTVNGMTSFLDYPHALAQQPVKGSRSRINHEIALILYFR